MWTSNVLEYRSFIEAQAAEVDIERVTARQGKYAVMRPGQYDRVRK
jgi:hypothetical protein